MGDGGLGLGVGGLGMGDWGLGPIPNPQSPIPNPQSPIPNPPYIILINQNISLILYLNIFHTFIMHFKHIKIFFQLILNIDIHS